MLIKREEISEEKGVGVIAEGKGSDDEKQSPKRP